MQTVVVASAVVLGAGALVWTLWWRPRRRQAMTTAVAEQPTDIRS